MSSVEFEFGVSVVFWTTDMFRDESEMVDLTLICSMSEFDLFWVLCELHII